MSESDLPATKKEKKPRKIYRYRLTCRHIGQSVIWYTYGKLVTCHYCNSQQSIINLIEEKDKLVYEKN